MPLKMIYSAYCFHSTLVDSLFQWRLFSDSNNCLFFNSVLLTETVFQLNFFFRMNLNLCNHCLCHYTFRRPNIKFSSHLYLISSVMQHVKMYISKQYNYLNLKIVLEGYIKLCKRIMLLRTRNGIQRISLTVHIFRSQTRTLHIW